MHALLIQKQILYYMFIILRPDFFEFYYVYVYKFVSLILFPTLTTEENKVHILTS